MTKFIPAVTSIFTATIVTAASAQSASPAVPKVGEMAPDVTLISSSATGVGAPVKLSSLRGRTVVLAFFPKSRTSGCTTQMKAYRDRYAELFGTGKHIDLFAVSRDSAAVQASWAADEKFPFRFLSDASGDAGHAYGTLGETSKYERRVVFIIGPDGRIKDVMDPFLEIDATAYTDLASKLKTARGQ